MLRDSRSVGRGGTACGLLGACVGVAVLMSSGCSGEAGAPDSRAAEVDGDGGTSFVLDAGQVGDAERAVDAGGVLDATQVLDAAQVLDATQSLDAAQSQDATQVLDAAQALDATQAADADPIRDAATADAEPSDAGADAGVTLGCPAGSGAGPLGGARPAVMKVPSGYHPARRYPLIIELGGRGATAANTESVFQMGAMADRNGIFVIAPEGTLDTPPQGTAPATFWNATDGCCNLYGSTVDDVAYLRSLICHTQANYSIDPNKVFIIGGSNGAFMAHRMACDAADLVTAIIALSGVTWNDPTRCQPTHPVSVLHIHGTADTVVPYDGTAALFPGPAPSARATYDTWAQLNDCTGGDVIGPSVDFDGSVAGRETTTLSKPISGPCRVAVQLWTIVGGSHTPSIASSTKQFFIDWFKATPPNHP